MSEPFDRKLLERLQSMPCATLENLAQQQQVMQTMLSQFYNSNVVFALSASTDLNDIVAYPEGSLLIAGVVMWAISTGDVVQPSASNANVGMVLGKRCANKKGENPEVTATRFFFRGSPTVSQGTVFAYLFDKNGDRIVIGAGGSGGAGTNWAITQGAPTVGAPTVVSCRECLDAVATGGAFGPTFDVILPGRTGFDLYLPTGSVISYTTASDDTYVVESDYSCAAYFAAGGKVGARPILNFVDTPTVEWTLTDVAGSNWVKVEAEAIIDVDDTRSGEIEFTLTADMSSGSAAATVNRYYGSERDVVNPGSSVTVYDGQDLFTYAKSGAKGKASYDKPNDKYWITNCQQLAIMGKGLLTADLATTDADASIGTISVWNMNPFMQSTPSTITAANVCAFEGLTGAIVIWARDGGSYRLVQIECT
jgi:hypothetical protein